MALTALVLAFASSAIIWFAKRNSYSSRAVPDLRLRQLTSNSNENRVTSGAILPDGKYLAYTDGKGMYIKLIETGVTQPVPKPKELKSQDVEWETGPWHRVAPDFLPMLIPMDNLVKCGVLKTRAFGWFLCWATRYTNFVTTRLPILSPDGSSISFGTEKDGTVSAKSG
jgi:hypothetical protein